MRRRSVVVVTCALAVAAIVSGAAQSSQQQRVFRAGTIFVSVDAYPRKDDKIVEGLTKADFEVLEDGKPQTVEELEFIRVSPVTPDDERRDPTSVADGERQAADPHNRVFVVYLDIFNTTLFGSRFAREPIIQFLSRAVGRKDLFAVMTPELPVTALTFARRTETFEDELRKYWDWSAGPDQPNVYARSPYEARLLNCDPINGSLVRAYRKDLTANSVEQMIARLGGLRDERKNILFVSEGWTLPSARMGVSASKRPSIPTVGVGPGGKLGIGANMSGMSDAAWCDAQFAMFAGIDYPQRFREMVNMATRANVAFYPIDVGGLRTDMVPASRAPQPGENPLQVAEAYRQAGVSARNMLNDLAGGTDGRAIMNTNDLTGAVRKIADDLSAFYLLGYYSSNAAADGKFRRIEVKVKQPGVKVSARRGYLGPTEALRKAELEAASKPAYVPTAVDKEMARLSRLRTDARLFSSAVRTPTGLDVVVEIASGEFSIGGWSKGGSVKLDILSKDDGAKPTIAEGKLEGGSRGILIRVPLAAPNTSGWRVRARVEGGTESLDDEIEIAPPAASVIGEPTVFRANPGPRSPLRPVADFKFFRTERVHVEWIITKPLDERVARLLTRKNEPLAVPVALSERMDGDRLVLAADLVLAPLADGDYAIEVTGSAGGEKFQRLLAFRVVR